MHASLKSAELKELDTFVRTQGSLLYEVKVDEDFFKDAPVLLHYTREMYFRLLAYQFLPNSIDRILYLDPDILVLNQIRDLYDTGIDDYFYAAADHTVNPFRDLNKIRLFPYKINAYYNSGVLLMNLEQLRQHADKSAIYKYVEENHNGIKLIMPDQDILNALYANRILELDEKKYNYDARYYNYYLLASKGLYDIEQVVNHTVILHFCGTKKPWRKGYSGRFIALYKHYEKLSNQFAYNSRNDKCCESK